MKRTCCNKSFHSHRLSIRSTHRHELVWAVGLAQALRLARQLHLGHRGRVELVDLLQVALQPGGALRSLAAVAGPGGGTRVAAPQISHPELRVATLARPLGQMALGQVVVAVRA